MQLRADHGVKSIGADEQVSGSDRALGEPQVHTVRVDRKVGGFAVDLDNAWIERADERAMQGGSHDHAQEVRGRKIVDPSGKAPDDASIMVSDLAGGWRHRL